MSNTVEGWYPDPAGTAQLRWWDGYSWTDDYLPDDTVQDYGADSYSEADQAYTGFQDAAPTYRHPVAAHRGLHRRRDRDNQPVPLRQQGVQAG